jgi:hypothetical protein
MRANIISYFRNVPARAMTDRESEKFAEILQDFLTKHTEKSMVIQGIDVWHHKLTLMDAKQPSSMAEGKRSNETEDVAEVTSVEITIILRITISNLPLDILGSFAALKIDDNQEELL